MVISTGELLIVIGGTVEASVTLNMCDPSRAVSSMIDTIAHAMSSFTPGVNVISSGSAAEKSSPITINIRSKNVNWIFYTVMVKEDKCRRFDTVKTTVCQLCKTLVCRHTTYTPALAPLTRVRVAMRGQPNPPEGRSVI